MKKHLLLIFFAVVASFCILLAGVFVWFQSELQAPSAASSKKEVLIVKGSSAEKIAKTLAGSNIIKSELVFRIYLRIHHLSTSLPPGQFSIAQNLSVPNVVAVLLKGPNEVWVTIPEGLRREQIPSRFVLALGLTEVDAQNFSQKFLGLTKNDEGYLFPETYLIPKDVAVEKVVSLLKDTFQKKFGSSYVGMDLKNVVILASLLERETKNDSEKSIVAGILMNRIRLGMTLGVDATVQYAKANVKCQIANDKCDWWGVVYLDDYKIKSSFNTYLIAGLPPFPIANPGLTSLQAAASPASTDYLYYLHDKNGVIHYAKTLPEHTANVQKYLR